MTVDEFLISLGALIKNERKNHGITQDDLAEKAYVDKRCVINVEKGRNIETATLASICSALGIALTTEKVR